MDHRIARSIIHPDHIDGALAIHANSRTVRVAHRVRQRLRQESQSAIGGSAEQDIGVVGGIIFPHHIDVPGCVHRSLRSHREIGVVRHILCCGEWQLRLRTDAHGQQTQKCYGCDLAEAAGVNHETLLKRSTNKIWIYSGVRFKNGLNCLWPVVGGLRNWRILRLLLGTLALGDDEKQAQLTLRSVVKSPERKGKLKYYVSKVASARTRTRCHRFPAPCQTGPGRKSFIQLGLRGCEALLPSRGSSSYPFDSHLPLQSAPSKLPHRSTIRGKDPHYGRQYTAPETRR